MGATDSLHPRVSHELFDALERADVATVDRLYAPGMTFWFNITGQESSREDNLAALTTGAGLHRRRTYDDRIIHTFDDGFLATYTCRVVTKDGSVAALSACLVATIHDGLIVHLAEYLDSSKFTPRRRKPKVTS